MGYQSWGRVPRAADQLTVPIAWRDQIGPALSSARRAVLARGLGRSQGDSCLNNSGVLLDTVRLDRFLGFDAARGVLCCEAGVTLDAVLRLVVPHGWFLPVTPGTKFVTVAGAVANDVHGKNHHRAGTFGRQVTRLLLVRSDGRQVVCSPREHADLFAATIGGLGLTGVIAWVEFSLQRITSSSVKVEVMRTGNLDDFFALCRESDEFYNYTVAWVDCLARGLNLGRGLFIRGNFALDGQLVVHHSQRLRVPCDLPSWIFRTGGVRGFTVVWYWLRCAGRQRFVSHYDNYFYPLDGVQDWNRIYGESGFYQYQCVVPLIGAPAAVREILGQISESRLASFLSTLKVFGDVPSPGLISFPRPGVTLAVDFANSGRKLLALFERLDRIVQQAGGALYPAKDGRMSGAMFRHSFPQWEKFRSFVDPKLSSSFWRRVML